MPKERNRAPFDEFGADMKETRNALGLSQKTLAEMVNIDPRYLANIDKSTAAAADRFIAEKYFKSRAGKHTVSNSIFNLDDYAVERVVLCAACRISGSSMRERTKNHYC